ncbi:unnamed protein product [Caenorhabditis auriculariae]|uniref:KCTD8/12/16 H1 domain-containing protein n=1 Tax=Caenorhabditis auriculariae TaxID=2777116 RepID=A0A8S1GPY0_9PELO|nr:unnamed protein product [Caenorhabditis auriculariae]
MAATGEIAQIFCTNGETIETTRRTLSRAPNSPLATDPNCAVQYDARIVSILIDALRRHDMSLVVPESFDQWAQLSSAAQKLKLAPTPEAVFPSTITIACHAALSTGRLNPEVTFRKVLRIVVAGKVTMCRSVFGDSLNERRDGGGADFEMDRYTSRFFLKHSNLERAFDQLAAGGYRLTQANTFAPSQLQKHANDDVQFIHHSQFLFIRQPKVSPHR